MLHLTLVICKKLVDVLYQGLKKALLPRRSGAGLPGSIIPGVCKQNRHMIYGVWVYRHYVFNATMTGVSCMKSSLKGLDVTTTSEYIHTGQQSYVHRAPPPIIWIFPYPIPPPGPLLRVILPSVPLPPHRHAHS